MDEAAVASVVCTDAEIEWARSTVNNSCHFQRLLFVGRVEKLNSSGELQQRLLVLGEYEVISAKNAVLGGFKIRRRGHLYDVLRITTTPGNTLLIDWPDFCMKFVFPRAEFTLVVNRLLKAYASITYGMKPESLAVMEFAEGDEFAVPKPEPKLGGFLPMLRAHICLLGLKSTKYIHVERYIDEHVTGHTLDLNELPGMEIGKKDSTLSLRPFVLTLQHNSWFDTLILRDAYRHDAVSALALGILRNTHIRVVRFSNVGAKQGFNELATALKRNEYNNLSTLDLSYNKDMGDKGLAALAPGIAVSPLMKLNVAGCNFRSAGIAALVDAFESTPRPCVLTALNISENAIGNTGSTALASWFDSSNAPPLRTLAASATKLQLQHFRFLSARMVGIEVLDVSKNVISLDAVKELFRALADNTSLREINFAECRLKEESVLEIITGLLSKRERERPALIAAGIRMAKLDTCRAFARTFHAFVPNCTLSHLSVNNCSIRAEGMVLILTSLRKTCPTLRKIDIGGNLNPKKEKGEAIIEVFDKITELLNETQVRSLHIDGKAPAKSLGKIIIPFIESLAESELQDLSVAGQRMGEHGMLMLADMISHPNNKLVRLSCDHNDMTLVSVEALARAVGESSLLSMVWPEHDLSTLTELTKRQKKKVRETLEIRMDSAVKSIKEGLQANRVAAGDCGDDFVADVGAGPAVGGGGGGGGGSRKSVAEVTLDQSTVLKADNPLALLAKERGGAEVSGATKTTPLNRGKAAADGSDNNNSSPNNTNSSGGSNSNSSTTTRPAAPASNASRGRDRHIAAGAAAESARIDRGDIVSNRYGSEMADLDILLADGEDGEAAAAGRGSRYAVADSDDDDSDDDDAYVAASTEGSAGSTGTLKRIAPASLPPPHADLQAATPAADPETPGGGDDDSEFVINLDPSELPDTYAPEDYLDTDRVSDSEDDILDVDDIASDSDSDVPPPQPAYEDVGTDGYLDDNAAGPSVEVTTGPPVYDFEYDPARMSMMIPDSVFEDRDF